MITICHLSTSRSERIVWLMEELGLEYRIERHARGRLAVRPEAPAFPTYLNWLHFAEGSLMTLMLVALALARVPEAKDSPVKARVADRVKQMLCFVDAQLARNDYFAGTQFTATDVMMTFPFTTLRHFLEIDLAAHANILAYLERIEARPAYRKAMDLAGPAVSAWRQRPLRPTSTVLPFPAWYEGSTLTPICVALGIPYEKP